MMSEVLATEVGDRVQKSWNIKNWGSNHQMIVAADIGLHVEVGDPKVALRFFLRSKEKYVKGTQHHLAFQSKWYSLCAEVLTQLSEKAVIKVTATATGDGKNSLTGSGAINLNKSKGKTVEVIDHFIYYELRYVNNDGTSRLQLSQSGGYFAYSVNEMNISVDAQMFHFSDTDNNVASDIEKNLLAEAEDSLINDLKNMLIEYENYADIKLESKDHMTLDAHKFILAARSRYLRKYIDDAMKADNFNGTVKMNVNGKPLVAILHWMYTGELHENAGSVMDEIVDCAVLFELTHMMKLLDTKVITICNNENMFRLYQAAQKNGMPNATDDIAAYIRQHL